MPAKKDLTGKRFGRLTVTGFAGIVSGGMSSWNCRCECGNEPVVRISSLNSGKTKSCGCLSRETIITRSTTHGMSHSREWVAWSSLRQRCEDKNHISYPRYGAIGIKVCERWNQSFENFFADMGKCPEGCSIDRINNAGDYEPGNCRWATDFQQRTNKRTNRIVEFNGKSQTAVEWDIELGFPRGTIRARLFRGFSDSRAVTQKLRDHKCRKQ